MEPSMPAPRQVELSSRAERDLRRLQRQDQIRLVETLAGLVADPPLENLDILPLAGKPRWLRLRVGDFRVLFRPLTGPEQTRLVSDRGPLEGAPEILVARVVHRRDLERALRTLEPADGD